MNIYGLVDENIELQKKRKKENWVSVVCLQLVRLCTESHNSWLKFERFKIKTNILANHVGKIAWGQMYSPL